jgi:hypothetical protein
MVCNHISTLQLSTFCVRMHTTNDNRRIILRRIEMAQDTSDDKLIGKDDFLLHQYDSLRTEILQRVATRYTIITITLTVFGAAFVIQNTILPLLFPVLALVMLNIYIANAYGTRKAANFIRDAIETQVTADGKHAVDQSDLTNIGWQTHEDDRKSEEVLRNRYSAGKAIFFVSSLAASIAGTLFNSQAVPGTKVWPGFIVASFVISALLAILVFVSDGALIKWFEERPSNEDLARRVGNRFPFRK